MIKKLRTSDERFERSYYWAAMKVKLLKHGKYPSTYKKLKFIKLEDTWKEESEYGYIQQCNKQIHFSFPIIKEEK